MGRWQLPDEEEQYQAYRQAVEGCRAGLNDSALSTLGPINRWKSTGAM